MPPAGRCPLADAPRGGGASPLDLIEEHLTDNSSLSQYRQGVHAGRLIENWYFPEDWKGTNGENNYVLKVQPFAQGGYEATVRAVDIEKIGRAIESDRPRGKREAPEEQSYESIAKSAMRAKKNVRHLVRNMLATHLLTLTRRESDPETFWNEKQWAAAWDRMRRLLRRVIGEFPYVAILESHKKGNYHLHIAWVGKVNVKQVRKMWLSIVGEGGGNIDARYIKAPAGHDRSNRIARYISKYVSKSFEENPRFNKKRYWASKQTLEDARRYVLAALTLDDAMSEVQRMLGLDWSKFMVLEKGKLIQRNVFMFPDGGGAWINYLPDIHDSPPPF